MWGTCMGATPHRLATGNHNSDDVTALAMWDDVTFCLSDV